MRVLAPLFFSVLLLALTAINLVAAGGSAEPPDSTPDFVDSVRVTIDRTTGLRMYEGRVFSGTAVTRYSDGEMARSEPFVDGRRHGAMRMWFANGQIAYVTSHDNGRRSGLAMSWWANGKKRSVTRYVNDLAEGISWHWYRSGEKFKRYSFALCSPKGLQQAWRMNGKLYSNFEYRNGRAYGLRNANLCAELDDETLSTTTI